MFVGSRAKAVVSTHLGSNLALLLTSFVSLSNLHNLLVANFTLDMEVVVIFIEDDLFKDETVFI